MVYVHLFKCFSYQIIIFNSHLFHLRPLFQEQNLSVKQDLIYWYMYMTLG